MTSAQISGLSALSRSFATTESFYVMGAGASVPHVPTTVQLSELLLESFLNYGVFQTEPISRDIVSERVIRDPEYWKDPLRWELVQRLPPNYVRAKLPQILTASARSTIANYAVFGLAAKPSTIFNMNVDRLANHSCDGHRILEPHGRSLAPESFEQLRWSSYTSAILDFPDLPAPTIPGLILPGPEPLEVLSRRQYEIAARLLTVARFVSLIGYSFGAMDDVHTYAFLTSRIPRLHEAVIIAAPDCYELAQRVSDKLKSTRVVTISASWHHLARAILLPGTCRKHHPPKGGAFCVPCVLYRHEELLDTLVISKE